MKMTNQEQLSSYCGFEYTEHGFLFFTYIDGKRIVAFDKDNIKAYEKLIEKVDKLK